MRHRIDCPAVGAVIAGSTAAMLASFALVRALGG